MNLISKIADIDGDIQLLVPDSRLPALNRLLDKSNDLFLERITELEKELEAQTKETTTWLRRYAKSVSELLAVIKEKKL
jgi:hypothetical protein